MIAVDSNVLVRIFAGDDEGQRRRAIALIEGTAPARKVFLNWIVIVETIWTLRRVYRFESGDLAQVVRRLTEHPRIVVPDKNVLRDAAHLTLEAGVDLPDALILLINRAAGADPTYTFDRDAVRNVGMIPVPDGA
jgi:predicted nucleic-acid-binding protein